MGETIVTSLVLSDAKDHAVQYGVMRSIDPRKPMEVVPLTLWPSRFPKRQFDSIIQLQEDYNVLIDKISQDRELLIDSLRQ